MPLEISLILFFVSASGYVFALGLSDLRDVSLSYVSGSFFSGFLPF